MESGALNKLVLIVTSILIFVFLGLYLASSDKLQFTDVKYGYKNIRVVSVGGVRLFAEIADTPEEWVRGLAGRDSLPPQRAMLFVFPTADYYKITVEGLAFPIDVFWINKDGVITDIWKHASPDADIVVRSSSNPAKYILETVADFAEEYGIEVGDKVRNLPR